MNNEQEIKQEMSMYIAGGNPSEDTLRHYNTEINNYLKWCDVHYYSPLEITERQAFEYLHSLNTSKYSPASISLKIAAAKTFYFVANKLNLISVNPFNDVKPKKAGTDDTNFTYFSIEEIEDMINFVYKRNDQASYRDVAIIMLMSVEGLRTVEVHRMNDEDIDWNLKRIMIHGKGKDSYIYPCSDTMNAISEYLDARPQPVKDDEGTPTFIGYSKKFFGERISRNGLRFTVNEILKAVGKKTKGDSCHTLRHSCGTNLYAETKDIRLVQETLRHSNPDTTARYAHIIGRMEDRQTEKIAPFKR